eukprot:CCRYP_010891-RA/>CCRYP_010891-RA protein AED:0.41 eAED:1.00 QI:0/0/0/1/0/0/4/0/316
MDIAKEEYIQLRNAERKKKGGKGDAPGTTTEAVQPALAEAKALYNKALKALEAVKLAITMAGAKPFKLYGNLLSDKARQPWEKIIKAQVTHAPWEDIKGVPHTETPTKTWDSFHECVMFHLLQVFRHDVGEAFKYYITNTLKKPNRVSIQNTTPVSTRALVLVLENIENIAELEVKPANTTKAKGADQKRKMESMDSRIPKKPKKVGWTDKHCVLCKKHRGPHKSHNTRDCCQNNKDGTPIKKNGGADVNNNKRCTEDGTTTPSVNYSINQPQKVVAPHTKERLGVTALLAIMEPATESQSSRAYKQPLRSRPIIP